MKKSKLLVVLLVVLACLMVLPACAPASNSNGSAESNATAESSAASEETTVTPAETEEASIALAENEETVESSATGASGTYEDILTAEELDIPEGQVIKIGYLAQNETFQFCIRMGEAIVDEVEKYGGQVELEMVDARGQATNQVSQAEDMVVKGVDAVIISAIDQDASAPAFDIVVAAGIPLISLNTVTVNNDIANTYVGVDDVEAGINTVKIMSEALGGEGNINIMKGLLGDPANENRMKGIKQELENHPGLTVIAEQAADWDRGKAMNLTEDWITSGKEFDGIIAMNDEMGISAALALNSGGITDVKIVGVDALDEALELIKSGEMYGTVFQDADKQGRGALNAAVCAVLGKDLKAEYLIPFENITAGNVNQYIGEVN